MLADLAFVCFQHMWWSFGTGFIVEEVGTEGQGYIWRPETESDDETEQVQDNWGEKSHHEQCSNPDSIVTVWIVIGVDLEL